MELSAEIRALVTQTAEESAERAVVKTFTSLGLDASQPIEAQRTFATLHELKAWWHDDEAVKDRAHLRTWRTRLSFLTSNVGLSVMSVLATGGVIWALSHFGITLPQ